jgi:YVTN family beta-propeller protein
MPVHLAKVFVPKVTRVGILSIWGTAFELPHPKHQFVQSFIHGGVTMFSKTSISRVCSMLLAVMLLLTQAAPALAAAPKQANPAPKNSTARLSTESLNVPFSGGVNAATTQLSFSGPVSITVSGVGQASGAEMSDAFYVYSPGTPTHYTGQYNFGLQINGQQAENFTGSVPPYDSSHIYTFQINAPGGALTFGVGDAGTSDNTGNYTVEIATLDTASVIGTIPVGTEPVGLAANPNTNRVYVTNYGSDNVFVIDGQTDTVVATIPVGVRPHVGVGISRSTGYVYVTNNGSNSVSVINPDTLSVINCSFR